MDFKAKKILITGGTRGIGAALARTFLHHGAKVAVCGRKPDGSAHTLGAHAMFYADLAKEDGCRTLFEQVSQSFGPIDILVNNAAIQHQHDLIGGASLAAMRDEVTVNFWAPLQLSMLFLPELLARPGSAIVNVTSGLVFAPKKAAPAYAQRKLGWPRSPLRYATSCAERVCWWLKRCPQSSIPT